MDGTSGSLVRTVTSDRDGWFSVALQPGRYLVRGDELVAGPARTNSPVAVTVAVDSYTTITVHIDRGIR